MILDGSRKSFTSALLDLELFGEISGLRLNSKETEPMVSMEANYNEKLLKVRNCLTCWEYRRLSLLGKIVVLKSLTASQLVYILSPLPTKHAALDEINNMFYDFLWSGRGTKLSEML